MALSRIQTLNLYVQTISQQTLVVRLNQLFNMLTSAQLTTVWVTIKNDLATAITNKRDIVISDQNQTNAEYDATIANFNTQINDINLSVP